jgi:hypothetical protein
MVLTVLDLNNDAFAQYVLVGFEVEFDTVPRHDQLIGLDIRFQEGLLDLCRFR